MLTAIFASKVYRASSRKEKIKAAYEDPTNKELILQLREYLDDEYIDDEDESVDTEDTGVSEDTEPVDIQLETEPEEAEESADGLTLEPDEEKSEALEESTKVQANLSLLRPVDTDEVLGILRGVDTTTGVERARIKDEELWLYYNDNINLNDIMNDVIELLNASGFSHIEFNRLARSDNAIVFEIYKLEDIDMQPSNIDDSEVDGVEFEEE